MTSTVRRALLATMVLPLATLVACGDDNGSDPPTTGSVEVTTATIGADQDPDGYTVTVGSQSRAIGVNDAETFTGLTAGATSVELSGVASNCSVTGSNPVSVTVVAGSTVDAAFDVSCSAVAPDSFAVGGTVSGLAGSGLVLQNDGADDKAISADGAYVFDTEVEDGSAYAVTVSAQPTGQTCSVANGSGTVAGAAVTNVDVTCTDDPTFSVGGTVSGLTGTGLVLQNNGGDNEAIEADGPYAFDTELDDAAAYDVVILTQPSGQTCDVANGAGTISGADVTDVDVACRDLIGNLDVTTVTGGADLDVDGYVLLVAGASENIGINETKNLADLPAGNYQVELTDVQSNCSVAGSNPVMVDIVDGQTEAVVFNVSCDVVPGAVGRIAFTSDRTGANEIWTMRTDGTDKQQLTFFDSPAHPDYSPDGTRILFYSRHESSADIYIMNADGGGVINLTNSGAQEIDPVWCSDGQFYAYVRNSSSSLQDVWVANLSGTIRYNLTKSPTSNDRDAAWSPDCTTIAFTSDRDGSPNDEVYSVSVADVANPVATNLSNSAAGNQRDSRPDYSPDGTQILFDSNRNGFSADIWVMDPDGMNQTLILRNDADTDFGPTWSPDAAKIAFTKNGDAQKDIYIMNADGTNSLRLTTAGAEDSQPSFSP